MRTSYALGMTRASIVVVTTVNAAGLERCLRSIDRQTAGGVTFETIVVLNGADHDVREVAHGQHEGVTVVESLVNRGFAGGCNLGRTLARGEFIVLFHDDAEAQEGWLPELVRCAEEHPEAGAVGSRVLHPDGRLQLAGAVLWRDATTTSVGPDDPDGYLERRPVDYTGSSSLLVRAAKWDAVGGMDERYYPAYYADADLAMAIRSLGQTVLYEPRSRILHHKGASSSPRYQSFVSARNRELFRAKWALELERQPERSEGLAAAFERSRLEAERFRAARPTPPGTTPARDGAGAERRFLRLDREINVALVDELVREVETLHAAVRAKESELAAVYAELERLRAGAGTAEAGPLRRLAGRLTRRAAASRRG